MNGPTLSPIFIIICCIPLMVHVPLVGKPCCRHSLGMVYASDRKQDQGKGALNLHNKVFQCFSVFFSVEYRTHSCECCVTYDVFMKVRTEGQNSLFGRFLLTHLVSVSFEGRVSLECYQCIIHYEFFQTLLCLVLRWFSRALPWVTCLCSQFLYGQ